MNILAAIESDDRRWQVVIERHPASTEVDFIYAVRSTEIYCRPGCPSKLPSRTNVLFFNSPQEAEVGGFRPCLRCRPRERFLENVAVLKVCSYIRTHLDDSLTLDLLGDVAGLSPHHFQRLFRRCIGVTPRAYASALRLERFKGHLKNGDAITSAMIDAGYSSTSRLYESADATLGMTPSAYRNGGKSTTISFTILKTCLGWMLVATTDKGICSVSLGDSEAALESELRTEYAAAKITRDDNALAETIKLLMEHIAGRQPDASLPFDVRATAFQRLVWNELQAIPYGETRTYAQIAQAIQKPSAVRAVANACANNRIALAIPCHRVVRTDGGTGGYRWGEERKKEILKSERTKNVSSQPKIEP